MISPVMPTYTRFDLVMERGEGSYLYTKDGSCYLDFTSGIAVATLGHAHPYLVDRLKSQIGRLWHCSNLFHIPEQEELAARLVAETFADTVFFANSGGEAVECAIKTARKYFAETGKPEKYRIITMKNAFHGRTLATLAAGGQEKHLKGFGPKVEGFDQVPFGKIEAVKEAITDETAAVMIEPVQGEGGLFVADPDYLRALRKLTEEKGILLVLDEVQCGMGRTGRLFAHEHAGVTPDIMAIAKGLGGGFPIGACLATEKAAFGMGPGSHGSTFGGNPLAVTAANAVLDVISSGFFLENVRNTGACLGERLDALVAEYPELYETRRGIGLMQGLKCRPENTKIVAAVLKKRLLSVPAGDNVVRLLPPLIIGRSEVNEAVSALSGLSIE